MAATDRRLLFLLQRATRAAIACANAATVERLDVSVAQLGTLSYVAKHPGCTLTDVANVLDLNKSGMSGMIRRLERARLLFRKPNSRDGRGMLLFVTEKDERVRVEARPIFRRAISDMTEGFTPAEMDVVLRFLNALVDRFGERSEEEH